MEWTLENRQVLAALLDQLIPANAEKGISAAGDLGVGPFVEMSNINSMDKTLAEAVGWADGLPPDLVRH